ncbi:hypothetical protein B0H21DRAFT_882733 [Amylocystis lapponica]|nr:hypothetical protein B0H21DRAFT_882733 [Amylocystis lapponica]
MPSNLQQFPSFSGPRRYDYQVASDVPLVITQKTCSHHICTMGGFSSEPLLEFAEQHDLVWRFPPEKRLSAERRSAQLLLQERIYTMGQSLPKFALSLSPKPPKSLRIETGINANHSFVLYLYSNYDLPNIPSDECINKLAKAMGYTENPRWFLDASHVTWMQWDSAW